MNAQEITKLEKHLRQTFNAPSLKLKKRPQINDSVEVLIEEEFIGVVYRDEDEGELSYQFQMCIIAEDLDD